VTWTRHKLEQLRHRKDKIKYLRYEKEEQKLAKMAQYAHDSERHSGKIAERVAHKNATGIAIVNEQGYGAANEGYDQVHGEYVIVAEGPIVLDQIADKHTEGDYE
jgi:hypothetical protein